MKNKKSLDIHNLNSSILKISLPFIINPLTYVYNLAIRKNHFPTAFKRAKVIPLPKTADHSSIDNFRPISILSILSKPLEKHIHTHLLGYLESKSLLHPSQSGFRPKHSCQTALTKLCDNWLWAINEKDIVGTVYLDLRKAFDLVSHNILIEKLRFYLQSRPSTALFCSYLSNRKQSVFVNGSFSSEVAISCGVPQGSILGPLLFSIFINDLPLCIESLPNASIDLFADDSTLHSRGKTTEQLQSVLVQSSLFFIHPTRVLKKDAYNDISTHTRTE